MTESKKSNWFGNEDQKGNFSNDRRDTFDPEKRYIGIRLQQGVPLLDRDWNELEDIRRNEERMLRKWYIGDGVPGDDGFKILALEKEKQGDDFKIKNGRCMVDGFLVINKTDEGFILYSAQTEGEPDAEKISELTEFFVYLDVWIEEVNGEGDPALKNKNDVNMETCVRHQLKWRVRVRSGDLASKAQVHHHYYDLARIERGQTGSIKEEYITDLRRTGLSLSRLREGLFVDKSGKVGIGTTTPADKLDVNGAIRFNGISDRRIYGDARGASGPQGAGSAVVLKGRWDELEVKGRVIDWTGSDLHIGHDQNHENHMVYIAKHCKLRGVEINAPLYVTKDLHVSEGLQIMNKPQDANGDTLILGDSVGMVTQGSNIIRYTSHLRLGYHQDYSWIQSYGSKPLAINPLGEKVGIGTTAPSAKLTVGGVAIGQTGIEVLGSVGASHIPHADGNIYLTGNIVKGNGSFVFRSYDGKGPKNLFLIDGKTGNVGIGTDAPQAKLDVRGDIALGMAAGGGQKLFLTNATYTHFIRANSWWTEFVSHPNEGWKFISKDNVNEIERVRITSSGNVGIGTSSPVGKVQIINAPQDANGNTLILGPTTASNLRLGYHDNYSWIQSHGSKPLWINPIGNEVFINGVKSSSDERLKTKIDSIKGALSKLEKVRGISFEWNGSSELFCNSNGRREIGLIAQEVETVFPELVAT